MPKPNETAMISAEQAYAEAEEALTRLERALLSRKQPAGESDIKTAQLEMKNQQMSRDLEEMKKHCIALTTGYDMLKEKNRQLENAHEAAADDLSTTLRDLDKLIAQNSLH